MAITEKEIIHRLKYECEEAGGQKAWAKKNKINESFVSDVLNGRRSVSRSMAMTMGFNRETVFTPIPKPN